MPISESETTFSAQANERFFRAVTKNRIRPIRGLFRSSLCSSEQNRKLNLAGKGGGVKGDELAVHVKQWNAQYDTDLHLEIHT